MCGDVEATHTRKCQFWNGGQWAKVKEFWPRHVPNLEEFGFKVALFFGLNCSFSTLIGSLTNHCLGLELGDTCFHPIEEGLTLKPSSSRVRHMSRPKFFYLGPLIFASKLTVSNMYGPPFHIRPKTFAVDWSRKWMVLTREKGDQLWNQAPQGIAHVKAKILLPWPTNLHFGNGILEHVWPIGRWCEGLLLCACFCICFLSRLNSCVSCLGWLAEVQEIGTSHVPTTSYSALPHPFHVTTVARFL